MLWHLLGTRNELSLDQQHEGVWQSVELVRLNIISTNFMKLLSGVGLLFIFNCSVFRITAILNASREDRFADCVFPSRWLRPLQKRNSMDEFRKSP